MQLPLVLPLTSSRTLLVVMLIAHGAGLLSVVGANGPLAVKALMALAVAFSAYWTLARQYQGLADGQPIALSLKSDGSLDLHCRHGDVQAASVRVSTTVFPWLVILRLKTNEGRLSLCLPPDAIGAEGHRQLRLWLSWLAKAE